MSADFVICKKDSNIVAVIELDDATHQRKDRQIADAKKDKALNAADIKIIRWQVKSIPDISTIQTKIESLINNDNTDLNRPKMLRRENRIRH